MPRSTLLFLVVLVAAGTWQCKKSAPPPAKGTSEGRTREEPHGEEKQGGEKHEGERHERERHEGERHEGEPRKGEPAAGKHDPGETPPSAGRWVPAGFGGAGNFLSVHADPRHANVVYAASDVAGVYRSEDHGDRWELRSAGLGNYEVSSFAVDPFDSNILYAGVGAARKAKKAGMYISRDAGRTWRHLPETFKKGIVFRKYRTMDAIAPDPSKEGVILAGSAHAGLWRSTDRGKGWRRVLDAPRTRADLDMSDDQDEIKKPYPAPVSRIVFAPHAPKTVFATLYGAGVYRSKASGAAGSWKKINAGLPPRAKVKFIDVGSGGVLYVAADRKGIFRSGDGGETWRAASGNLPLKHGGATSVAVHPTKNDVVFMVLSSDDKPSVWKTVDGGKRWKAQENITYDKRNNPTRTWSQGATLSWWISFDRREPRRLYFTDYWGIQRSDDGGERWQEKIVGAQNTCVTSLTLDTYHPEGEPDTLFMTNMDAGILKSTDRGETWRTVYPKKYDAKVAGHYWGFAIARVGKKKYYFATLDPWDESFNKVLRSSDGVKWEVVFKKKRGGGEWMAGALVGLAVDPTEQRTLYVSQDGGKVFVSRDAGKTWRPTPGQPDDESFTYALAVDRSHQIFAGTLNEGLWRSSNRGRTWKRVLKGQDTIWRVIVAGQSIYASTGDANLHLSTDGGASWRSLTRFKIEPPGDEVGDQGMGIAINPRNPKHIIFTRVDTSHSADAASGIVESLDGGKIWKPAHQGLGLKNANLVIFGRGETTYAGTWGGSIWRRDR